MKPFISKHLINTLILQKGKKKYSNTVGTFNKKLLALSFRQKAEGEITIRTCLDPVKWDFMVKGHLKMPLINKCKFYLWN